ncbi:MAG: hypothetical protein K5Q68_05975 [Roseococcus sp.]|nr:hypothetical protein [Roseococcus sp.]
MKALEGGVASLTPAQAIRQIESWEAHLAGVEVSGTKTLLADLGALKRALQKDPLDGAAIGRLMAKLAIGTARIAGRADGKRASQVEALGKALETAAQPVSAG